MKAFQLEHFLLALGRHPSFTGSNKLREFKAFKVVWATFQCSEPSGLSKEK